MTPTDQAALNASRVQDFGISLSTRNVTPPVDSYIGKDDQLGITIADTTANDVVTINMRILLPDGTIVPNVWTLNSQSNRGGVTFFQPLTEGFILSVLVTNFLTGATRRMYCSLFIFRGGSANSQSYQVLCQGYPTTGVPLSWPSGVNTTSLNTAGNIRSITGTLPAAGVEISETVPASAKWLLRSLTYTFTASAAVANRFITLAISDGSNIVANSTTPQLVTANAVFKVTFAAGFSNAVVNTNQGIVCMQLLNPTILMPGWKFTTVSGLQAADQLSSPFYEVEEFLLP